MLKTKNTTSRTQKPRHVDSKQQNTRSDGGDDDGVVRVAAVDETGALDEHDGDDEVGAALLFEGDDHDVQADENEHGLEQEHMHTSETREASDVLEGVTACVRGAVKRTDAHNE